MKRWSAAGAEIRKWTPALLENPRDTRAHHGRALTDELRRVIDTRDRSFRHRFRVHAHQPNGTDHHDDDGPVRRNGSQRRMTRQHVVAILVRILAVFVMLVAFVLMHLTQRMHFQPMMMMNLKLTQNLMTVSRREEQRHKDDQQTMGAERQHPWVKR
ncbi:MAG: hypothetical protein JWQ44_1976 [Chthoniobacter sp.]|nr:hypothetical protein [Chthoniobacter sp.]